MLNAGGRAAGVVLKKSSTSKDHRPQVIRAAHAVVSNASIWDTARLLSPSDAGPLRQVIAEAVSGASRLETEAGRTPMTKSFMHLHLGEPLKTFSSPPFVLYLTSVPPPLFVGTIVLLSWWFHQF